jgi:1-acyl-sn-glycerol-3-phosphate acyltransferase
MLFEGRRKPGEMSGRYRLFRRAMTLLCRLLFGYRVHGGEMVPSDGPLIVASNHSQYADPVLVCVAVPRRLQ